MKIDSVVACQRYLCPYVIPMTMNAFIFKNLSLKTVLLNHMSNKLFVIVIVTCSVD